MTAPEYPLAAKVVDLDAAEDLLDAWVRNGRLAIGDRFTREGSDISILIARSITDDLEGDPVFAWDADLVFSLADGHLYRRVNGGFIREGDHLTQTMPAPRRPRS